MQIKIESVDRDDAVLCGGYTGYRGIFSCSVVTGSVLFMPSSGMESNLIAGNHIWFETGQESIGDFTILAAPSTPGLMPLPTLGDYDVTGQVEVNSENKVFYIDVLGFSFALDVVDTNGQISESGDYVSFIIHGLQLWDINL